jgi:hypothetical protein
MSSSLDALVPLRMGVNRWSRSRTCPRGGWRHDVLIHANDLDVVEAAGILDQDALALARTAVFAVLHDPPKPSATRAMLKCWTTMISTRHRNPQPDSESHSADSLERVTSVRPNPRQFFTAAAACAKMSSTSRLRQVLSPLI